MSFILDALRKSESERRRESAPNLHHVPLAVHREGVPTWVWSTIALLSLSVVALGAAWWQSTRDGAASTDPASGSPRASLEPAATGLVPTSASSAPAAPTQFSPSQASPAQTPPAPASVQDLTGADPRAAPLRQEPTEQTVRSLPSLDQVVAEGVSLPPLELQLLSYSENVSERFVFINGYQYRQGQRVQNGPLIVGIYSDGVALRHGDREFALLPE